MASWLESKKIKELLLEFFPTAVLFILETLFSLKYKLPISTIKTNIFLILYQPIHLS